VLALDGIDFKKHSAVIAYFQKEYVKTGIFDTTISRHITSAFQIRNESDYEDFFLASKNDATEQLANAREIFAAVDAYIKSRTTGAENPLPDTPVE
jgi:uncharacterized protein (UPF0332 family)